MLRRIIPLAITIVVSACDDQSKSSDLSDKPDKWVNSLALQSDSKVKHVGKSSVILGSTTVTPLSGLTVIAVGDDIDGVHVGAIKCTYFPKDASYSGEQFMWRDRWGCMAGRSRDEVENAVQEDGTKLYDYLHIAPVTLAAQ
ncbi:hypothetical protein [Mesorhizobium opportunistum]|uniref:Lipoprotein n=1 Tax=Mesorhizobium opportunistum (strain LMG 24607 / HAMBI 3007 / WSM2075) TaxID=536019 RepID=F7YCA5_MESOW|nr:hypothetical protein [Mesorhizobium opportunistum]AEH86638.1 conserved hypothetical protein [Mesorhizobium opportunistum WSM2075]